MLKKSNFIILLLLVTFLKGLAWSFFVPLWHFPDEQAHFAHVAYLAEGGKPPIGRGLDLSEEILISEQILRTKRDGLGNNKFTYNPKFNIDYSDSLNGLREDEIINLPKSTHGNFIKREAATYGYSYYRISTWVYKLFYEQNLFIRVFMVRIFWLICILGVVGFAYLTAKEIFPKNELLQISIPLLVSFQPMFTFVASGVTIDNWVNLLFTAAIYFSLKILFKPKIIDLLFLGAVLGLGISTKNNFLIGFGLLIPLLFKKSLFKFLPILAALFLFFYFIDKNIQALVQIILSGSMPYLEMSALPELKNYSLWQHLKWTINHTIGEVLPWYWGVFRWLSLVLPRWVNRILMRLLFLAAIGLIIKLVLVIRERKITRETWRFGFIVYSAVLYFVALLVWDWIFYRSHSYSFGVQGRYYFPVIVSQMILLAVGFETFFRTIIKFLKLKVETINYLLLTLNLWFIVLNLLAFFWLTASYYDTSSFYKYIIQASQYKPWFAKSSYLIVLLLVYGLSLFFLIVQLTKFFFKHAYKKNNFCC